MAFFSGGGARNLLRGPLGQLTQANKIQRDRELQEEARRDAKRANRFATLGTLAGMGLGATLGPGGSMAGASLGAGIGGQLGRAAGGGQIQPTQVAQLGLQGASFMDQQAQQQQQQQAAQDVSSALGRQQRTTDPELLQQGVGQQNLQAAPDIGGAISALGRVAPGQALGMMIQQAGQQRGPTMRPMTPQEEVQTFGRDVPGTFQVDTATGDISQIGGTAPEGGGEGAAATGQVRLGLLQQAMQDRLGQPGATERPVEAGTGRRTAQPQITGQGQAAISPLIQASRLPAQQLGEVPEQTFERLVEGRGERPSFTERQGRATSAASQMLARTPDMSAPALTDSLRQRGIDPRNVSSNFWSERFSEAEKPSPREVSVNLGSSSNPRWQRLTVPNDRETSNLVEQYGRQNVRISDPEERDIVRNFRLPSGQFRTSRDGRTYVDPNTDERRQLPPNAVQVSDQVVLESLRKRGAEEQAEEELEQVEAPPPEPVPERAEVPSAIERAALEGTGAMANMKAGINAVFGGFQPGEMFPQTQRSRQKLRVFREHAIESMAKNPRVPVREMERLQALLPDPDTFWTNPDTEAENLRELETLMSNRLRRNLQDISSGDLSAEEIEPIREQNRELRGLIDFIQEPGGAGPQGGAQGAQAGQQELQGLLQADTSTMSAAELRQHNDRLAELLGADQ